MEDDLKMIVSIWHILSLWGTWRMRQQAVSARPCFVGDLPHTHTMTPDFPRHIHFITDNPGGALTVCS